MKRVTMPLFVLLMTLVIPSVNFAQEEAAKPSPNTIPQFQLFHMYMEYGSGELGNAYGERLFEQIDVKMTFSQNLNSVRWLSFGFVGQVTWDGLTARIKNSKTLPPTQSALLNLALPSTAVLTATVGFLNNIFTIGAGTDGTIASTIYYNKVLPNVPGLYSHDVTFLFSPTFFIPGNQHVNGVLTQAWFDSLEMRFAYRMKFNRYVGLRPEFLFNFTGTDLIAGKSAQHAFMFRFNPRLQFYAEKFSFFIEPRFFYIGNKDFHPVLNSDNGFIWEIKVGFDITHLIFKD